MICPRHVSNSYEHWILTGALVPAGGAQAPAGSQALGIGVAKGLRAVEQREGGLPPCSCTCRLTPPWLWPNYHAPGVQILNRRARLRLSSLNHMGWARPLHRTWTRKGHWAQICHSARADPREQPKPV